MSRNKSRQVREGRVLERKSREKKKEKGADYKEVEGEQRERKGERESVCV